VFFNTNLGFPNLLSKKLVDLYRGRTRSFGNAREVIRIVNESKMNMGLRLMKNENVKDLPAEMFSEILEADIKEVFEDSKTIVLTYKKDGVESVSFLTINGVVKEGVAKQYFVSTENGLNGDIILTKDAEHKQDMVVSRYILNGKMFVNESYVN
jgi:hypothetical protein